MKMKRALWCAIASLSCLDAPAQNVGDSVTIDALTKLEWVQGSAPEKWEPGKVYMLECWATWCLPCVFGIPHVDELYDKYHEKGLEVLGIDVWEDGKEKVAEFVKNKGDGMSYPVAYTGRGGAFETEWLKPSGVNSIPRAYLVKDGKVLSIIHPALITDALVEGLLEGGEAQEKALADANAAVERQSKISGWTKDFQTAEKAGDAAAMEAALAKLKEAGAPERSLSMMELDLKIAKKDWAAVEATLMAFDEKVRPFQATYIAQKVSSLREDIPQELFVNLVGLMNPASPPARQDPTALYQASKLEWLLGKKEEAVATAERALEIANRPLRPTPGKPYMAHLIEAYLGKLREGEMPSEEELQGWLDVGMANQREAAQKAAKEKAAAE